MQDLRYAFRSLRKQPLFTLVAVLTLTLGIGANSAIFSIVYQALLRPLPYPDADRLVFVWNTYPLMGLPKAAVSIPDYLDRKTQAAALEDAALFTTATLNLAEEGRPEQLRALSVTPSFFSTLGRQPALGRAFRESDARAGEARFAILTHGLWQSRFGSDAGIVGKQIRLSGAMYSVVGVLPPDFELPAREVALLVPFAFTLQQMSDQGRGNEFSSMIARLRPGATIDQANAQFKTIVSRNLERLPQFQTFAKTSGFSGYAVSFREELVGDVRTPLYVLQAGVVLVLLIACANVANLLLMRATGRQLELAVRTTLGAGQWRIVKQLLVEGLVLSAIGAVAGLVLGLAGVRALVALTSQQIPGLVDSTLNAGMVLFTVALALVTGLVFGIVPALVVARGNTSALLKDDSARASAGRGTGLTRAALVIGETALALVLLVGAGLLIKSFVRLQHVDPGFSAGNILTARIALPEATYRDDAARSAFWQRLVEKVRAIPGVTAVGLTSNIPLSGMVSSGSYSIVGYTPGPGEARPHARQEVVGADFFRAMHIPLVKGRLFNDGDTADRARVVVVDKFLVDRYFKGKDPIGQQIERGGRRTIVGVVGTVNSIDLGEPVTKERIYTPLSQAPRQAMSLIVKTGVDPQTLAPAVRSAVTAIDPEQPVADVRTMEQWVARSLEGRRTPAVLLAVFGAVALVLSAIGIYGVLAFSLLQRLREFGIRQALGADRRSILALVLLQGLRTAGLGLLLGLGGAWALTRYLQSLLFGVEARDPAVFAAVTLLLLSVATAACCIPAWRATRIDPVEALREA